MTAPQLPHQAGRPEDKPPSPPAWQTIRTRGRPTKLTHELIDAICKTVALGNYIEVAAALEGVPRPLLFAWLKEGAKVNQALADGSRKRTTLRAYERLAAEFNDSLHVALAMSESADVFAITKAVKGGDARVALARLGKKFPRRWGGPAVLSSLADPAHTDPMAEPAAPVPAAPIAPHTVDDVMDLSNLSDEELDDFERLYRKAAGP